MDFRWGMVTTLLICIVIFKLHLVDGKLGRVCCLRHFKDYFQRLCSWVVFLCTSVCRNVLAGGAPVIVITARDEKNKWWRDRTGQFSSDQTSRVPGMRSNTTVIATATLSGCLCGRGLCRCLGWSRSCSSRAVTTAPRRAHRHVARRAETQPARSPRRSRLPLRGAPH